MSSEHLDRVSKPELAAWEDHVVHAGIAPETLRLRKRNSDRLVYTSVYAPLLVVAEPRNLFTRLARVRMLALALSPEQLEATAASLPDQDRKALLSTLESTVGPAFRDILRHDFKEASEERTTFTRPKDFDFLAREGGNTSNRVAARVRGLFGFGGGAESRGARNRAFGPDRWRNDVGFLFLDRTRIRPVSFALGEHIFSLGLAPAEEVVLEERVFTKRQITMEDVSESERQLDLELASTLSSELQEGLERTNASNSSSGFTAGGQIGIGPPVANLGVNVGVSNNSTEADTKTRNSSVKTAYESSTKVAAKYRSLHRVTYKVATEFGFESTSRRTIRNPNQFTGISLQYYRVLRVVQLKQERYGLRLCWAPTVRDPGGPLARRIAAGRAEIEAEIATQTVLPNRPTIPPRPNSRSEKQADQIKIVNWDINGGTDISHEFEIEPPAGLVWDGDGESVKNSLKFITAMKRERTIRSLEEPRLDGGSVKLRVRVHVDPRDWREIVAHGWDVEDEWDDVIIEASATFTEDPNTSDAAYKAEYEKYRLERIKWEQETADLRARTAAAIVRESDAWEKNLRASSSTLTELVSSLVDELIPYNLRNDPAEVTAWRDMFDWNSVYFELYPGWWSSPNMRKPTESPESLLNASWAQLYLPVQIGAEASALRWLYGPLFPDAKIDEVVDDLNEYRTQNFGSEEIALAQGRKGRIKGRCIDLGTWYEKLPTDGSHVETLLSSTTAMDAHSRDARALDNGLRGNMTDFLDGLNSEDVAVQLRFTANDSGGNQPLGRP